MQTKTLKLQDVELKMDESGRFAGYASVFGGVDSYGDTILKGAYEYSLKKNGKPKMYVQHESWGLPVGKWLTAKEDDHGLFVEGEFTPGMAMAQDAQAALKHGTVDGLSIGYMLKAGDYEDLADGKRLIKRVSHLAEVSIVTYPADTAARIDLSSVKSVVEELETIRDFERFLRDAGGLSKGLTQALISRAKIVFGREEPGTEDTKANPMEELAKRLQAFRA
jgi:HK97 family phage prohead protease